MQISAYIHDLAARFEAARLCYGHGTANPFDEAVYLVYSLLEIDFHVACDSLNRKLSETEFDLLEGQARRRISERRPVAYLVNRAWFAGFPFNADERALIPRSPIAELIVKDFAPLLKSPAQNVLDLCCGGGCIGLALALRWPHAQVMLADVSAQSLDLAWENVRLHGLQQRVKLCQADLFAGMDTRFELIVANPPYVPESEYAELAAEFGHEPRLGLISGNSGLDIPLRILRAAADFLTDRGILVMEVGYTAAALSARLPDVPFLWLQFDHGGDGVLALSREQLLRYRDRFN